MFGTDFSPASGSAFTYALAISDLYHSKLYVAHVISLDIFDLIAPDSAAKMLNEARERAHAKIEQLLGPGGLRADRYQSVITRKRAVKSWVR